MNVSDFGKKNSRATPAYGTFSKEKQDIQSYETFQSKGKQFPDSQDLMGGPQYHPIEALTKEKRANYGGTIKEGKLWSEGRYHA